MAAGGEDLLFLGLAQLDAEASARHGPTQTFATPLPPQQDAQLTELAAGHADTTWPPSLTAATWFHRLVDLAHPALTIMALAFRTAKHILTHP